MQIAYGTEKRFFEIMASPTERMTAEERLRRHGMAMRAHGGGEGFGVGPLVEGYEWESLGEGTVVDVGFSFGFPLPFR